MNKFTDKEIKDRLRLVKPIVEAAFSIRGRRLTAEEVDKHTPHWEAAFGGVATEQLYDLYRAGLQLKCSTAEEFQAAWEKKIDDEYRAREYARQQRELSQMSTPLQPPAAPSEYIDQLKNKIAADSNQSRARLH